MDHLLCADPDLQETDSDLALRVAGGGRGSAGVPSQPGGGRDRTAAALRPAAAHRHWSAAAQPADQ